jgi:hypothetical protein
LVGISESGEEDQGKLPSQNFLKAFLETLPLPGEVQHQGKTIGERMRCLTGKPCWQDVSADRQKYHWGSAAGPTRDRTTGRASSDLYIL